MIDDGLDDEDLTTIGDVDDLGFREVKRMIGQRVLGSAWYSQQSGSTNSVALDQARADALRVMRLPRLFLADIQTAGRGRHGRTWISDESSLTFSILIDWHLGDDIKSKLLSIAVGLGVAESLEYEFAPRRTTLKWPNDVQFGGGKVAGVLLESSPSLGRVVIGVGINVGSAPDLSSISDAGPTRSISNVIGRPVHRYELIESVVTQIGSAIDLLDNDIDEVLAGYRRRCALSGQSIRFDDRNGTSIGKCLGIDDDGSLMVQCAEGLRRISSGEARLFRIEANDLSSFES